jgi:dihydrofolate synthase/folylpolyglutamate synthase
VVALVTNVELDHVEYLGPTRRDIAEEKAGIVKPGSTLVLGETDRELVGIFASRPSERVVLRDVDFGVHDNEVAHGGRAFSAFTPYAEYHDLFLPLHGRHQVDNAVAALTAVECFLERPVGAELVAAALASVTSPGRLEVAGHAPLVVIDGTKNLAGAHAVRLALEEEFGTGPRTWVVGVLRQKDAHEMLAALGVQSRDTVVCCRPEIPRARDPRDVVDAARELGVAPERIELVDRVADAVDVAIGRAGPDGQVIVAGSLYVAGPARAHLVH